MGPSSCEEASFSAIHEFRNILRNPKVRQSFHKNPPLASVLSQINLFHTTPSYLSKVYLNILHPPMSRFCTGLLPSGFPIKIL
jgi:hypothetical protein